jgi:riboflavin kinase/FMN adenylyltransferase
MELRFGLDGLRSLPPDAVISVGNFDGMHLGHARIVETMRHHRQEKAGRAMAAVTFEPHPFTVLRPAFAPPRLTPAVTKRRLLGALGIDYMVELAPERAVLNLAAEDFWGILQDQVRPSHIVEGETFTFGRGRGGTVQRMRQWADGTGICVHVAEGVEVALLDMQRVAVSSTVVRWLLAQGRVRDAAICLGRAYRLCGPVIRGYERGRTIGVPTANLACEGQLVPGEGVYAGRCELDGRTYPAAVSIGTMPTFGQNRRQIEAHLVGFDGDLYGREIEVELVDWTRKIQRFSGVDMLKRQLDADIAWARERSSIDPARPVGRIA